MILAAFDQADRVMAHAMAGRFEKDALAGMLTSVSRAAFLDACAHVEKRYTKPARQRTTRVSSRAARAKTRSACSRC
jgi:hypothetical protein